MKKKKSYLYKKIPTDLLNFLEDNFDVVFFNKN